jgi:DNA ligase (NAD+)
MVTVEKAADVIPKVSGVVAATTLGDTRTKRPDASARACMTTPRCPCERRVTLVREDIDLHCRESDCPEVAIARIVHFASKQAMDIEGLGEGLVRDLFRQGLLRSAVDIYTLLDGESDDDAVSKRALLAERKGWGEKKIANLLRSVERSKHSRDLGSFLFALGIPHLGKHTAQLLAVRALHCVRVCAFVRACVRVVWSVWFGAHSDMPHQDRFSNFESLMTATEEDLRGMHGVGDIISASLTHFLADPKNRQDLKRFALSLSLSGVGLRTLHTRSSRTHAHA